MVKALSVPMSFILGLVKVHGVHNFKSMHKESEAKKKGSKLDPFRKAGTKC